MINKVITISLKSEKEKIIKAYIYAIKELLKKNSEVLYIDYAIKEETISK